MTPATTTRAVIYTRVSTPMQRQQGYSLAAQDQDASLVAEALVKGGFGVRHLEVERPDLETAFMQLTQGLVA